MLRLSASWKRNQLKVLWGVFALWLTISASFIDPFSTAAAGQDGAVDPTFQSGSGPNNTVNAIVVQPDGKILIAGILTTYNDKARNGIARINSDGSLDLTFNPGTGANAGVSAIALQPDGKILIGGDFTVYNATARNHLARLNSDGSLDTTFNPGTGANAGVSAIVLQPDGKIIIAGLFTSYNNVDRNYLARINADGSLDTSFNPGSGANDNVYAVALQTDGKIVIGGIFTSYKGVVTNRIARVNIDGTLDTSFNPGTGANNDVNAITIQPDGKIFIAGNFTTYSDTARNRIARINADGTLDTSFNPGTGALGIVNAMALQADGKIIIGGQFIFYNGTSRNRIARINADGSLDISFSVGNGVQGLLSAVALQADSRVLIGGSFSSYTGKARNRIARLNPDGSLDSSFLAASFGANGSLWAIKVQPDDKILIGGDFSAYNGTSRGQIARLNTNGSIDTSFNPGIGANSRVYDIALQTDGKILIGGNFTFYNGVSRNSIARINPNGSLDTTFLNVGTGANQEVRAVAIQPDGKILIVGLFTSYNATTRNRVARLNSDGSLDSSFLASGVGADAAVTTVAVQPDGKILIGGLFATYNGTSSSRVARLNSDGSLDTTFLATNAGASGQVNKIVMQEDGKIIIGGSFNLYNGISYNRIARLNPDGSPDTSFLNNGAGIDLSILAIVLQPNGKILMGGQSSIINGVPTQYLVRFNPDGSPDATFDPGLNANNIVYTIALQSDGKILTGGTFTSVDTYTRDKIARLENSVAKISTSISVTSTPNPSLVGDTATFTATVNPAVATGTVTFTIGITNVTASLNGGVATYVTDTLPIGSYPVTATYGGSMVYSSSVSTAQYTHTVISCNPLVVTSNTDNGTANICGTFSYAVLNATSGMTITFNVPNIIFSGVLTPALQAGVIIDGGANGVILDGSSLTGDGLVLGGNNKLINLTIKGFNGRGLVVPADKTGNKFDRVRIIKT